MAQDLSRVERRVTRQDRVTTNRDGLIPTRNQVDAAPRQINADLRSAQRGDSARQLAEIFGAVNDAAGSFQGYVNNNHAAKEQQHGAQGVIDQAAGIVDPELQKRSHAYSEAVSTGEAVKGWYRLQAQLEAEIDAALNDPDDPASPEEIDELISHRFTEFAVVDGKPRDFGSLKANRTVAEGMVAAQPKLMAKAREIIKTQVEERSISTAAGNWREGAIRGDLSFEQAFSQITPGTDLKRAKASLIDAGQEAALSLIDTNPDRALAIVDGMLSSKREDGTSFLAPEELEQVRVMRRRLASEAEDAKAAQVRAQHKAQSDSFMDRLMGIPGSGSYPSTAEIQKARAEGRLEAESARTLLNWIETDVREAEADRRARQRAAAATMSGHAPSGNVVLAALYEGRITPQTARREVLRRASSGDFGAGNDRKKALSALLSEIDNIDEVRKSDFTEAASTYQSAIGDMRRDLRRLPGPRRRRAEQWLKRVEDGGTAFIGKQMANPRADGRKVGEAATRSLVGSFLRDFPELTD